MYVCAFKLLVRKNREEEYVENEGSRTYKRKQRGKGSCWGVSVFLGFPVQQSWQLCWCPGLIMQRSHCRNVNKDMCPVSKSKSRTRMQSSHYPVALPSFSTLSLQWDTRWLPERQKVKPRKQSLPASSVSHPFPSSCRCRYWLRNDTTIKNATLFAIPWSKDFPARVCL